MEDIYSGVILHLIGYHGCYKSRIAKEISKLTAMQVIDREMIGNLLLRVLDPKESLHPKTMNYIHAIRQVVLKSIVELGKMQRSYIITDEFFEGNAKHLQIQQSIEEVASKRGSIYIPIKLACNKSVISHRLYELNEKNKFNPYENMEYELFKSVDIGNLMEIRHPKAINIDISEIDAPEIAKQIVKKIERFL